MPAVVTMCVGDSITMGSTTYLGCWRRLLNNLAPNLAMVGRNCTDGTYGYTVGQHEGYSGAQTTTFASIAFADAYAPSLVLLMLGTNDLSGGKTAAQTIIDVVAKAEEFLAKSYCTHVIVGNIAPRPVGNIKYQETVDVRAGLQAAVEAGSDGLYYCDPCADLVNPGAHFSDTLHPSEAGYALMAPRWYAAIRALGVQTDPDRYASVSRGYARGYT